MCAAVRSVKRACLEKKASGGGMQGGVVIPSPPRREQGRIGRVRSRLPRCGGAEVRGMGKAGQGGAGLGLGEC